MQKIKDKLALGFVKLCLVWVVLALCFDVAMLTLSYTNPEMATRVGNEIAWKIDGTFKNDPNNIWYTKK